jgi:hypothetical protein
MPAKTLRVPFFAEVERQPDQLVGALDVLASAMRAMRRSTFAEVVDRDVGERAAA